MQLIARAAALAIALVAVQASTEQLARAYPQFQFTTGVSRCSKCHFSPAGGGLIKDRGRLEATDTISGEKGDGSLLHGLWTPPDWLAIGGDYRGALIAKNRAGEQSRVLAFPMQLDVYTRLRLPASLSLNTTVGVRGAARPEEAPSITSRIMSRELYLMWQPKKFGKYARAGRFFAPYGLRLQDHTSYIRRYLGFNTLEEPLAVSYGDVRSKREYHATLYAPSPLWHAGPKAYGGAVYYEQRIRDDSGAIGAQAKVDVTGDDQRYLFGGVGKLNFESANLLLMGELDLGVQRVRSVTPKARGQLAAYLGLTYYKYYWANLGTAIERYDDDLLLSGSARDSINVTVQSFFRAHWEIMLLGKLEFQGQDYANPSQLAMLMVHYYL